MPTKNYLSTGLLLLGVVAITSCNNGAGNAATPAYRDLNKNGKMDVYEDSSQPIAKRVDDLLHQMTLEEKAGLMFINGARVNDDGSIEDKPATGPFAFAPNALKLVKEKKMNHIKLHNIIKECVKT